MNEEKKEQKRPYNLTQLEVVRLQDFLNAYVKRPSDLAEHWGISESAANIIFVRIRVKMNVHTTHQMFTLGQRAGVITMTYDASRGDANIILVRRDDDARKQGD